MVTGYYRNVFGPALRKRLESFESQDDALALYGELDLLRSVAADAVALYSAAMEDGDGDAIMLTGQFMTKAVNQVRDMVNSIARIEQCRGHIVTRDALNVIARQLTQAAYEAFGSDDRVDDFLESINSIIENPNQVRRVEPERFVELMLNSGPLPTRPKQLTAGNGNGNGNGR